MYSLKKVFIRRLVLILIMSGSLVLKSSGQDNLDQLTKSLKKVSMMQLVQAGLKKVDIEGTPSYFQDGKKVDKIIRKGLIKSGEYQLEPYVNTENSIKLFVFRESTEAEKDQADRYREYKASKTNKLVNKTAPSFDVEDINGNRYSLEELKGKVVVLNFWFIECKGCIIEIPELNKLVKTYEGKDVVFLAIALNDKQSLIRWEQKKRKTLGFKYSLVGQGKDVIEKYEAMDGFPTNIIIDQNSKVAYYKTSYKGLKTAIDKLLE